MSICDEFETKISCNNVPFIGLLQRAYDVKRYQVIGPAWIDSTTAPIKDRYRLDAKFAAGTTRNEVGQMVAGCIGDEIWACCPSRESECRRLRTRS